MNETPRWWMKGDWFDVCSCNVPCPCSFAQAPDVDGFGLHWGWVGRSSKHIPFDWTGPDGA
jgi:hypothetical protein